MNEIELTDQSLRVGSYWFLISGATISLTSLNLASLSLQVAVLKLVTYVVISSPESPILSGPVKISVVKICSQFKGWVFAY